MTSYPGQPVPPRRTMKWIGIASIVVGLVVTGIFAVKVAQNVPSAPVRIGDAPIRLEKEGVTIYASQPVLRPPCEVKDANGDDIPLERPSGSQTITLDDRTFYVIAHSVDPVQPQEIVVNCTDADTNATYYAGARVSIAGFVLSIFGAIGSFLLFLILGVVLIALDATKRRRANRPPGNTFPGPPGPGGTTFPGSGHTFPGPSGPSGPVLSRACPRPAVPSG